LFDVAEVGIIHAPVALKVSPVIMNQLSGVMGTMNALMSFLLLFVMAMPFTAFGGDTSFLIADARIYDNSGRYQGRTDQHGRRYDSMGRYEGRIEESGRVYDATGRYQGRIDDGNGSDRHYDAMGRYAGRQDDNGRRYDAQGRYQGRIESNGRQYDAQGRYIGRIDK
jgi:hypothetical protein